MSDRTPPTGTVRHAFVKAHPFPYTTDIEERYAEFDRWLEQVKAEAWEEGHNAGQHNEHEYRPGRAMANPYRKETDA